MFKKKTYNPRIRGENHKREFQVWRPDTVADAVQELGEDVVLRIIRNAVIDRTFSLARSRIGTGSKDSTIRPSDCRATFVSIFRRKGWIR